MRRNGHGIKDGYNSSAAQVGTEEKKADKDHAENDRSKDLYDTCGKLQQDSTGR
jgi:hypothetical protein